MVWIIMLVNILILILPLQFVHSFNYDYGFDRNRQDYYYSAPLLTQTYYDSINHFSYQQNGINSYKDRTFLEPIHFLPITNCLNQLTGTYSSSPADVIIDVRGYAKQLKGTAEKSLFTGRTYYAFRGIYYAEKPTNITRFLPPIPKAPYPSYQTVDATLDNEGCPQPKGTEDCLTLNVFTLRLPLYGINAGLPVMVWIHGGGNSAGKASDFIPDKYMEEDIVLVVIQYRLGPLGWLSFATDDVPGNAAAFDMIEALRWVRKHIGSFGGDRNKVTIIGESGGSKNAMLLLLAPQARGLFHGVIAQSGNILPSYAYDSSEQGNAGSTAIAGIAGCPTSSYEDKLNCVRNIDPEKLCRAFMKHSKMEKLNFNFGGSGSSPVIQTAGSQRIIEEEPRQLFSTGRYAKVPLMIGANKHDGSFILGALYRLNLAPNNLTNNSTYLENQLVPDLLRIFDVSDSNGALAASLTSKYLARAQLGNLTSMAPGLTDICSILWLKETSLETAEILTQQGSKVYLYSFEFQGKHSYFNTINFPPPTTPPFPHGVSHEDELIYLFSNSAFPALNKTETTFSKQMIAVWTNFIKQRNPTPPFSGHLLMGIPRFPSYSLRAQKYMSIDQTWTVKTDYTTSFQTN